MNEDFEEQRRINILTELKVLAYSTLSNEGEDDEQILASMQMQFGEGVSREEHKLRNPEAAEEKKLKDTPMRIEWKKGRKKFRAKPVTNTFDPYAS